MPNIVLTSRCNLSCSYCFAKKFLNGKYVDMSEREYDYTLNYFMKNGLRCARLVGGEPTLHPNIIKYCKKALRKGFTILLITNGVWQRAVSDYLKTSDPLRFSYLINVNHPSTYKKAHYKKLLHTLEQLKSNPSVTLSINLDDKNCNYNYLFELIEKYDIRKLRYVVPRPFAALHDSRIQPKPYSKIIATLLLKASKLGVQVLSDCSFITPCLDNNSTSSKELASQLFLDTRPIPAGSCGMALDILPGLQVIHCFAIGSRLLIDLRRHVDYKEIEGIFHYFRRQLIEEGSKCKKCNYFMAKACSGGCISSYMLDHPPSADLLRRFKLLANKRELHLHHYKLSLGTKKRQVKRKNILFYNSRLQYQRLLDRDSHFVLEQALNTDDLNVRVGNISKRLSCTRRAAVKYLNIVLCALIADGMVEFETSF